MGSKVYLVMLSSMGMIMTSGGLLFGQDPSDPLLYYGGKHAQLSVAKVTDHAFEIVLAPLSSVTAEQPEPLPGSSWNYPRQVLYASRSVMEPVHRRIGEYSISILRTPIRATFRDMDEEVIQQIAWPDGDEGKLEFFAEAPLPGFDLNASGSSEEPVLAIGEKDWAILFRHPLSTDNNYFYDGGKGVFIPSEDKKHSPVQLFLVCWEHREQVFGEYRSIAGRLSVPHVWSDGVAEVD